MNRSLSSFELKHSLLMKDQQIELLRKKVEILKKQNETIKDWNFRWQTERWSKELADECIRSYLKLELRGESKLNLLESSIVVLGYLSSIEGRGSSKAERHVLAISRMTGIKRGRVMYALKQLQKKRLVRAWNRGNKKEYYTLPLSRKILEESNLRTSPVIKAQLTV